MADVGQKISKIVIHLLPVELRRVIVDDDDVQKSRRLLRRTAEVRHVEDEGVVGARFAVKLDLKTNWSASWNEYSTGLMVRTMDLNEQVAVGLNPINV